ncbi:MAG: hypothetical protein RR034_06575, partial [Bacteroidales bacterium]
MVYVVSIADMKNSTPSANLAIEKALLKNLMLGRARNEMVIIEGLKDKTDILDQRYLFYVQ